MQVCAISPMTMSWWMPCFLSCKSRSVLAKPLEHQCSVATISPGLGSNSERISPPQVPYSKLFLRHAALWTGATYFQVSETWKYVAPVQRAAWRRKSFEYGTWGGEIRSEFEPKPGEIVATEHWCSSGFANTDLDLQLKKQGVHQLIVIGLIAHTCIEATVRYAAELGYDVTVVKDATADYSDEMMHVALDINLPNYASAIVTTDEIVAAIATL